MTAQPLRLGGLALLCALATATLVLVTTLASQLVLAAVAAVGLVEPAATVPHGDGVVQGTLVSAETDEPGCDASARPRAERCGHQEGAPVRRP